MIEALDMSRRVGKTYLTNKMKEEICKCGHNRRSHLTEGRCVQGQRNERLQKVKCKCKQFKPKEENLDESEVTISATGKRIRGMSEMGLSQ